ncbi:MAG: signal peptidase I [Candidatus Babeliales bacterium]
MIQKTWKWFRRPNKSTFAQYVETFLIILPLAFVIRTYFYGLYQVPTGSMETTMLVGERFFADKFTVLFWPPKRGDIISFNDPVFEYSDNKYKRLFEQYVWGPSNWTKRVIGIPGDHIKGIIEDGKPVIYLNDEKLDEPYVNKHPLIAVYKEGKMPPFEFRSWDKLVDFEDQPFYKMDSINVKKAARLLNQFGQEAIRYPGVPEVNGYGRNVDEYDVYLGPTQYWVMGDNRRASNDSRFWGPLDSEHIHGKIVWRIISVDSSDPWLVFDILQHPIEFWSRVRWNRFFQRMQ